MNVDTFNNGAVYTGGNVLPSIARYRNNSTINGFCFPNGLPSEFNPYDVVRGLQVPNLRNSYGAVKAKVREKLDSVKGLLAERIQNISEQMKLKNAVFGVAPIK